MCQHPYRWMAGTDARHLPRGKSALRTVCDRCWERAQITADSGKDPL